MWLKPHDLNGSKAVTIAGSGGLLFVLTVV